VQISTQTVAVVVEPELVGALRMVMGDDLSVLQAYGVNRVAILTPDSLEYEDLGVGGSEFVVYMVRPITTWMHIIAGHYQQYARRNGTWPAMVASRNTLSYLEPKSNMGTMCNPTP